MKSTQIRTVLGTVVILAVALALIGCPPKPTEELPIARPVTPSPTVPAPEGEPIKIGAIFSVTGRSSPLGDPEKKTAEMREEQVNASGGVLGRPLEVIVKDDESMPDGAVKAANDLIEQGVVAIIGPSTTPSTMPLKDICEEAGVPLIACAAGKTITDPVASYVFAVPQTNALAVQKCFEYLEKEDIKKIGLIYVANPYGEDGKDNVEEFAAEKDVEIVATETFGGDDTDMTTQLTKIKAAQPGALICWGTNPGPSSVTKDAKTIGLDVPILQSHGVANMKFIELAGEAANGVQLPAGRLIVWEQLADGDPHKDVLRDFATAYQEKYDQAPSTFAGHAYDSFWIAVQAITEAGEADRAKVRDAIEQIKDFQGTAGVFNYSAEDHNGLTLDAFVWVEIVDGAWQLVE